MNVPEIRPKILVTSGEPAGIGPDITLKALSSSVRNHQNAMVTIVGDINMLIKRSTELGMSSLKFKDINHHDEKEQHVIPVMHINARQEIHAGQLDQKNSPYVIECINSAVDLCLSGQYDGMVTAPVHKGVIHDYGFSFSGHTEWIADRCGSGLPVMMLASDQMKVCLATTHLPINAVPEAITKTRLKNVLTVMHHDLNTLYQITDPIIGVCGLNPHAGEEGYFGREEIDIISPIIRTLRQHGMRLLGPLAADTAFIRSKLKSMDAILSMYHDQGLPVIKHSDFGNVVNVTLGLPIIRTSIDHGTALDLAGTGKANEKSLISAINLAIQFVTDSNR